MWFDVLLLLKPKEELTYEEQLIVERFEKESEEVWKA